MRTETPKILSILGLTLLLCIAFDISSVNAISELESENTCASNLFETISCSRNNVIHVVNALYGYSNWESPEGGCYPDVAVDCFLSIPSHNFDYYETLMETCNNRSRCRPYANWTDTNVTCHGIVNQQSDYVRLEYYCLPSSKTIITETICLDSSDSPFSTSLSCAENESVTFVGAILGFQESADEPCDPGEDRCRAHPDTSYLNCIDSTCHGQQNCTVYAATYAPANSTCSKSIYMYENITYFCEHIIAVPSVNPAEPSCFSPTSTTTTTSTTTITTTTTTTTTTTASSTTGPTSTLLSNSPSTRNTPVDASEATTIDYTTVEPYDEGEDNTDLVIGVSIACAIIITAVIVGVTAALLCKRKASSSQHGHVATNKEHGVPYSEMEHDGHTDINAPQTQSVGTQVSQSPSNGAANGVNTSSYENGGLPNGRRNSIVNRNGSNSEDDHGDNVAVKLTAVKALRSAGGDGYEYATVMKDETKAGTPATAARPPPRRNHNNYRAPNGKASGAPAEARHP